MLAILKINFKFTSMIKRKLLSNLEKSFKFSPIIGLLGSRQVGKTTLAKELQKKFKNSIYIDLELPSDLNKLNDAEFYLGQNLDKLIIIDEIQRKKELFPILRALVDVNRKPGMFLLLGSSSPDLIRQSSESLAGRIVYHELSPFLLSEIATNQKNEKKLWLRGGYPESFLASENDFSTLWRNSFIQTYLERDIPQLGFQVPAMQLRKFWTMLAHNHGQIWNASKIGNAMGVSSPTAKNYLEILNETFIIRNLPPYYKNIKKRLIKSPKIYIRDSGILHTLLNIKTFDDLLGHPIAGYSWEGFIIEQIINNFQDKYEPNFYRTNAGAELDLVLTRPNEDPIGIEIKLSLTPKLGKSFWNSFNDVECKKGYVIYPGDEVYKISEEVTVCPLNYLFESLEL